MVDTATPETGPVDAPASNEGSVADRMAAQLVSEIEAGSGDDPDQGKIDAAVQELVNEAESDSGEPPEGEPAAEDDATEPADDAQEAAAEATHDEPVFTVKVNGEEIQVPQSELLNGYSRTADYKQKTAAVAEERRQLEARKATIEADVRGHYANQLEEATNAFAQFDPVLQEAQRIDWAALKATDPAAYVQAQDAVQARLQQLDAMKQQVATARQEAEQQRQEQQQQSRAQRFESAAENIVKAIPELADEARFADFARTNIGFLEEVGFTKAEIADSLDHRVLTIADEARQWRAHKAAQASLPPKKVVQTSAVKPLTTDGTGSRAATRPRPPSNAPREKKVSWAVNQMLQQQE